jgi:single-strand DNA-binding protein
MARNTVSVAVVGNLTGEPEMRFTPAGVAVARFTVAVNERTFNKDSAKWEDGNASFYRCTAWRGLAENVVESLPKGTRVVMCGELRQRSWRNDAGDLVSMWEVTVDAIGPDLSYATAAVKKMSRSSRDEVPPDDAWATGSREPVAAGVGQVPDDAEPPF